MGVSQPMVHLHYMYIIMFNPYALIIVGHGLNKEFLISDFSMYIYFQNVDVTVSSIVIKIT